MPGDYQVKFTLPNNDYIFSKANQGNNPEINSKVDSTGLTNINVPTLRTENFDVDAGLTTNGKVEIQKLSGQKALSDAVYSIKDSTGTEVTKVTTAENGLVTAEGLSPGKYTATEITAPIGYQKNPRPKSFTIVYGNTEPVKLTFQNIEKMGAIMIFKQDGATKKGLENAIFTVETENGRIVKTVKSNEKGYALASNLLPGTYIVKETAAPEGYEKSNNEMRVTIPFNPQGPVNVTFSDTKIKVPPTPTPNPTPSGTDGNTTDGIVIKEVDKNVKTKKGNLPETGDSTNKNVLFGGALLATAGIALMYRRNN